MCLPWFINEVFRKNSVHRCGRNLFIVDESSLSHNPFRNKRDIQVVDMSGMFGGVVVCSFFRSTEMNESLCFTTQHLKLCYKSFGRQGE